MEEPLRRCTKARRKMPLQRQHHTADLAMRADVESLSQKLYIITHFIITSLWLETCFIITLYLFVSCLFSYIFSRMTQYDVRTGQSKL